MTLTQLIDILHCHYLCKDYDLNPRYLTYLLNKNEFLDVILLDKKKKKTFYSLNYFIFPQILQSNRRTDHFSLKMIFICLMGILEVCLEVYVYMGV